MSKIDTYSNDDLREILESEGVGYAVQNYVDADLIEDEEVKDLFRRGKEILDQIDELIEPEYVQ